VPNENTRNDSTWAVKVAAVITGNLLNANSASVILQGANCLKCRTPKSLGLPSSHIPEPHRPLGAGGVRLWNQVWQSGAGWLKQNMDTELVLMLCEATEERTRLRIMLQADQSLWRERRALREVDRQIITLLGQIGFTPSERGMLGTGRGYKA
jgi:hypothetical protein